MIRFIEGVFMAIAMIVVVLLFSFAGCMDYEDETTTHEIYCEMVDRWNEGATRGIPERDRVGWAPYNGECK